MNNPLAGTDPSGYLWCGTGSLEKAECNDERKHKRRDSGSVGFRAAETIWINGGPAASNGARHSLRSAATGERERGAIGGPGEGAVRFGGESLPDQSISEDQLKLAISGKFLDFWKSRWAINKDPVARTALIGWGEGDLVDAGIWEELAAEHTWSDLDGYISDNKLNVSMKKIGADLALAHARAVIGDTHGIKGLLSPHQVAQYHHQVFDKYSIPAGIFGGTHRIGGHWYMPDVEVPSSSGWTHMIIPPESYSDTWCGGCDTTPRSDGR